jgi:site-specific DNA-cytosine methylase
VENGISKTQIYKMAGNSIPVKMLEHLFRQLYPQNKVSALKQRALELLG